MVAVRGPLAEIEALIAREKPEIVLANRNSPQQAVLSGSSAAVAHAARLCRANGFAVKALAVGGAFHSPLMQPAQAEFAGRVAAAALTPTGMPVFSNVSAQPYPSDPDAAKRLLAEHMGRPVDFLGQIEAMFREGVRTFLEVGPKSVLTGLVGAILEGRPAHALSVDASAGQHDGVADLARVLCRLAALGHAVAIEKWEDPAPAPKPMRMSIPILGANYRQPAPQPTAGSAPPPRRLGAPPPSTHTAASAPDPDRPEPSPRSDIEAMRKNESDPSHGTITDALRSVQEGLKTIQTIQIQTAHAHQKFLETQGEATRVLLELVKATGRLGDPPARAAVEPPTAPTAFDARPLPAAPSAPTKPENPPEWAPSLPSAPLAAAEPAAASGPPPDGALQSLLLAVVAELTGYPAEMLGLDMDIEADLGIDSIKRVEILSTLEERRPGLRPVAPEDMGRLKTLGQIIEFLGGAPAAPPGTALPEPPAPMPSENALAAPADSCLSTTPPPSGPLAERRTIRMQDAPTAAPASVRIPKGRKVFVTDDRAGLSQALLSEFGRLGINAVLVSTDILQHKKALPHAAGLVIVQNPASAAPEADLRHSFELTAALAGDLVESARQEGSFFATVTRMDGAFGFSGRPIACPVQGALAGLAKTAAAEWPEVVCRALDIDPAWSDLRAAAQAVAAHAMARGPVEIGISASGCRTPLLVSEEYPEGEFPIRAGDAVVVSGGARGITAACALELARRVRPSLILLGRSPEPVTEPEWMQGLTAEPEIKKALIQHEFTGASVRPADVERRLKQLLANREISHSLAAIQSAGSAVRYYSVDVRDARQVQSALADARLHVGPIRGLIHGAGVVEDRLIAAKSMEQFERVFETKLNGFRSLLAAAAPDALASIVIFSSVTARIGNRGQADYAMANEALNKLAHAESLKRPGCRVVSINWGPWECGMVTAPIKREFERQGVTLLAASEGALSLIREMARPAGAPVEVVIGGTLNPTGIETAVEPPRPRLNILFEREIDVESYPVLNSHVIDGKPVVPMALIAEWFGHGALHENPGLILHGLEDMRILSGIRLGKNAKLIRLLAGKALRRNGHFEVELELRNGVQEGKEILHSRVRAILAEGYGPPPAYRLPEALGCNHYPRSSAEIYAKILFHGRHLQGLRRIRCCTAEGMVADAAGAPAPAQWMAAPLRNTWLSDPLVLDAAFQMASLWCYEQHGCVSLPSHAASYRQYRHAFPSGEITVVLEVRASAGKKMHGDFTFLDAAGEVIARLTGYEAVMDPLLNRAFKPDMKPSN
jgi:malonyl CoA-acyl carrier protein transacylase/NADP-dependent 3-hydroxy acid dehydrogenase YdfG